MLVNPLPSSLTLGLLACLVCGAAGAGIGYGFGYRFAAALGDSALKDLQAAHATQADKVSRENSALLWREVLRANAAEAQLLADQQANSGDPHGIEERIPYVVTQYRPAPAAAPEPIPHCVFTVGWLRDYNTALGVPGAAVGPVTGLGGTTPWAAARTDAELLESGVSPADILAHARDYGRWARNLASQVTALLNTKEGCTP